jgi:hypothetical protein
VIKGTRGIARGICREEDARARKEAEEKRARWEALRAEDSSKRTWCNSGK